MTALIVLFYSFRCDYTGRSPTSIQPTTTTTTTTLQQLPPPSLTSEMASSSRLPSKSTITLIGAALTAISCGTNYCVSAYLPQLSTRLSLTSTHSNLIAASGNLGMYLSGSLVGPCIDRFGPTPILFLALLFLTTGWMSLRGIYSGGLNPGLGWVMLAQALTGVGSSCGNGSAVNGVARSFGSKRRATALSVVFCCTGLSAFAYSGVYRVWIKGEGDGTERFLGLLAGGCAASMGLGMVMIRPALFPIGHPGPPPTLSASAIRILIPPAEGERQPLLSSSSSSPPSSSFSSTTIITSPSPPNKIIEELLPQPAIINIHGWEMLSKLDFWLLFGIEGLLSGIGLMYINNLGTLILTLNPPSLPTSSLQTFLVSLLSLSNACGRIFIGLLSDHFSSRVERVWWTVPVSVLFLFGVSWAGGREVVQGLEGLAGPTVVVGFAYGNLFGLLPVLCLEWFGLKSYSSNNGLLVLAPAIFGQLTNYLFGRIYDSNTPTVGRLCTKGKYCYRSSFRITIAMAVLSVGLSVVAGVRRSRRGK